MNEPDLPSDTDVSDEDYRPSGQESGAASEEESGLDDDALESLRDNENSDDEERDKNLNRKNGKKGKRRTKLVKRKASKRAASVVEETDNNAQNVVEEKLNPDEQKKKADSLWADFLKDCGEPPKKKQSLDSCETGSSGSNNSSSLDKTNSNNDKKTKTEEKENKSTVTQIFEFAGEKISVEKEVPGNPVVDNNQTPNSPSQGLAGRGRGGRGGGSSALTTFLGHLGKKGKLSTLEKSKLDWDQFKKREGIEEEIQIHNKGKDGYLERQDFLQRTDLRRFEIEKSFRQKRGGR